LPHTVSVFWNLRPGNNTARLNLCDENRAKTQKTYATSASANSTVSGMYHFVNIARSVAQLLSSSVWSLFQHSASVGQHASPVQRRQETISAFHVKHQEAKQRR